MSSIGPFPGWLAAVAVIVAIDWSIMQFDPQGAYLFALVILAAVLVIRPGAVAGITGTLGELVGSGSSASGPASADNRGAPANTGAPVQSVA